MKALGLSALLCPFLACSSAVGPGVVGSQGGCNGYGCGHGSSGGRPGLGGSSGAGSGSSSGSGGSGGSSTAVSSTGAGGTGSGGSTGGLNASSSGGLFVCGAVPVLPDGGGCPNGSFVSQLVNIVTCAPIAGAVVQALDVNGAPTSLTTTTAADGTFILCAPPSTAFTPYVTAATYATTYYSELEGGQNSNLQFIFMLPETDLQLIGSLLAGGYDTSLGTLIADVTNSPSCPEPAGWTFSLTDVDGGPILDGGYREVYLGASEVPDPTLTSTSGSGIALFYDMALSTTNFFGVEATNPDAGRCVIVPGTASYTGRIYATANAVSADLLLVP